MTLFDKRCFDPVTRMKGGALFVDKYRSTYWGTPWKDLGSYGKKKFENLLYISNAQLKGPAILAIRYE